MAATGLAMTKECFSEAGVDCRHFLLFFRPLRLPDLTWRRLWLALLCGARYFELAQSRKEGRAMTTFFRHYRQHGPVNALQMRLQG
jgi:hypothetical protein